MKDDVNILHLTDIHFGESDEKDKKRVTVLKSFLTKLKEYLSSNEMHKPDFVIISGDVAFRGAAAEYKKAKECFLDELVEILGIDKCRYIFCAGNHDVNQAEANTALGDRERDDKIFINGHLKITNLTKANIPFSEYINFIKDFYGNESAYPILGTNFNLTTGVKVFPKEEISFSIFNTSWCCIESVHKNKESDVSRLYIGKEITNEIMENKGSDAFIQIAVFHHGFNWWHWSERYFDPSTGGAPAVLIQKNYDLVFHGHEHGEPQYPSRNDRALIINGGAFYDSNLWRNHASIIKVNKKDKYITRKNFRFDPEDSSWSEVSKDNDKRYYLSSTIDSAMSYYNEKILMGQDATLLEKRFFDSSKAMTIKETSLVKQVLSKNGFVVEGEARSEDGLKFQKIGSRTEQITAIFCPISCDLEVIKKAVTKLSEDVQHKILVFVYDIDFYNDTEYDSKKLEQVEKEYKSFVLDILECKGLKKLTIEGNLLFSLEFVHK